MPILVRILSYGLVSFFLWAIVTLSVMVYNGAQVNAKSEDPLGECAPFFKDGALLVTRCIDTELDIVCYVNNYGFEVCTKID